MDTRSIYRNYDFNAFLRRRGVIVIFGMIMYLLIVLFHLYSV